MKVLYKGFSTQNYMLDRKNFVLTNVDLVNLDLLNHIFTERDERVMMGGWGTNIPRTPFEQLTNGLLEDTYDDLIRVFDADPRVEVLNLQLYPVPDEYSIVVVANLLYVELNQEEILEFAVSLLSE